MKKDVIVKKSAAFAAGSKYLRIYQETGSIASPVTFSEMPNGQVQASIDGEKIGKAVGMTMSDIPHVYEARVTNANPSTNEFTVTIAASDDAATDSEYSEEIEYAVQNGSLDNEDVEEIVKIMTENRVHPSVIKKALASVKKFDRSLHQPSAIYKDACKGESILNRALVGALTGNALIFAGEKSTGKNVCAETLAYVLQRPYYRINFEKDMMLEDIFGSTTTDNTAADKLELELAKAKMLCELKPENATAKDYEKAAEFELLKAKSACIRLVHAASDIIEWAKYGGVMMYDELNMASANTLQACMNSAADSEKVLIVPGAGEIKLNPDCVLLGGMNPGYAGTFELNEATKSRCGVINFEYPESIKCQLKANFGMTAIQDKFYNACDLVYKDFKAAVSQGRISSSCLNIRGFVNALKGIEMFPEATTLTEQIMTYVISGCNDDERKLLEQMLRDKVDDDM